jgi:hypothetical protein
MQSFIHALLADNGLVEMLHGFTAAVGRDGSWEDAG